MTRDQFTFLAITLLVLVVFEIIEIGQLIQLGLTRP